MPLHFSPTPREYLLRSSDMKSADFFWRLGGLRETQVFSQVPVEPYVLQLPAGIGHLLSVGRLQIQSQTLSRNVAGWTVAEGRLDTGWAKPGG